MRHLKIECSHGPICCPSCAHRRKKAREYAARYAIKEKKKWGSKFEEYQPYRPDAPF